MMNVAHIFSTARALCVRVLQDLAVLVTVQCCLFRLGQAHILSFRISLKYPEARTSGKDLGDVLNGWGQKREPLPVP